MPERIQRKRTPGWRMPENTVSVCRPGKWGNPFKLFEDEIYIQKSREDKELVFFCKGDMDLLLKLFRSVASGVFTEKIILEINNDVLNYWVYWVKHFLSLDIKELANKNLACFCPLDKGCHADVLIELANE